LLLRCRPAATIATEPRPAARFVRPWSPVGRAYLAVTCTNLGSRRNRDAASGCVSSLGRRSFASALLPQCGTPTLISRLEGLRPPDCLRSQGTAHHHHGAGGLIGRPLVSGSHAGDCLLDPQALAAHHDRRSEFRLLGIAARKPARRPLTVMRKFFPTACGRSMFFRAEGDTCHCGRK